MDTAEDTRHSQHVKRTEGRTHQSSEKIEFVSYIVLFAFVETNDTCQMF